MKVMCLTYALTAVLAWAFHFAGFCADLRCRCWHILHVTYCWDYKLLFQS